MSEADSEGWERLPDPSESDENEPISYRNEIKPINFLDHSYPLEPDMLLGWRPRLPIGPVPLTYANIYVNWLIQYIHIDRRYRLVYVGPRHSNSVKVNQLYSYGWKMRDRYRMNLQSVKQAIQSTGAENNNKTVVRETDEDFQFNSNFESGNLDAAIRVKQGEYDCFIRSDTNTKGHCNWFYFTVKRKKIPASPQEPATVRINICNFTKKANLYNKGMKPFVRQGPEAAWKQLGEELTFLQKYCRYGFDIKHQQLQFTYRFPTGVDTVAFAYGIPYTYTDLENYVRELKEKYPSKVQVETLCQSLGGVGLPLLTITDRTANPQFKQAVLISARMHPGESVSSHVLQGFLDELLSNPKYDKLLSSFQFRVVPMINPDGVIMGNFRTSYSGKDLNRQFYNLNKLVFPQIYSLHELAKSIRRHYKKNFEYYFDFHGHSTKTNLFCYGPEHPRGSFYYLRSRAFAKLVDQIDPIFSYNKSIFTISEHKKTTGRANMFYKLRIPMTYTFEMSNGLFCKDGQTHEIDVTHMWRAGVVVLEGFAKYAELNKLYRPSPQKRKTVKALYNKIGVKSKNSTSLKASLAGAPPLAPKISTNKDVQPAERKSSQRVLSEYRLQTAKNLNISKKKNHESSSRQNPSSRNLSRKHKKTDNNKMDRESIVMAAEDDTTKLKYNRHSALQALFKKIKEESEMETEKILEGGSDSEDDIEDLDKEQCAKLFQQIQNRNIREQQQQPQSKVSSEFTSLTVNLREHYKSSDKENQRIVIPKDMEKPPKASRNLYVRSVTARIKRSLPPAQPTEKYLLAQKSFVLNL